MDQNTGLLTHYFSLKASLPKGGATVKTLTFKNAAGTQKIAKRLSYRIVCPDASAPEADKYVHLYMNCASPGTTPTTDHFALKAGDNQLQVPFAAKNIKFLNDDDLVDYTVYVEAFSDEDISGSAWT